ncbi:phosphopantetheine-binding protein [Aliikangiella sp. IMCC44359]|uniref:phosphopantetheine-binding protein n=1 Tax=Aliikangiella sp. IMCC44359 TaxID=3459125 RepID=UPI00403AF7E2
MTDKNLLLEKMVNIAADVLKVDAKDISPSVNVQELGFDSTTLVSFVERVSAELDTDIHPGVFFEHSELDSFCHYLIEHKYEQVEKMLSKQVSSLPMMDEKVTSNNESNDPWEHFSSELMQNKTSQPEMTEKKVNQQISVDDLPDNLPVIIGSGIGGMLISRQLSRKNIRHIMLGSKQLSDSPRLGESMTEACTIEFTRDFKDYKQYFFRKDMTPFYMGDIVAGLRFDFFGTFASLFLDEDVPQTFIHVDRIGFDRALYAEVSQSPNCLWVEELVDDVDYDANSDKVSRLHLKSGKKLIPSFVWDCTNHIRLLGRKINIPYENFDEQRQVVYSHYYQKDGQDLCHREDLPWMHATTLLRADEKIDGIKGVSWFIPLGSYISVGISMEPQDIGDRNPEEILTALTRAYQRRGVDYSKHFSRRKEVVSIPSQHFMYDRFTGGNWAMVGGSAASTWFTSGSNISMLMSMATMADKIIEQPELYGEQYSRHVKGFARTQQVYDNLLRSDLGPLDATKFLSSIIDQARKRISSYYIFRNGLDNDTSKLAKELWQDELVIDKKYFEFLQQVATHAAPADISLQTEQIYQKIEALKANNGKVMMPYLRNSSMTKKEPEPVM